MSDRQLETSKIVPLPQSFDSVVLAAKRFAEVLGALPTVTSVRSFLHAREFAGTTYYESHIDAEIIDGAALVFCVDSYARGAEWIVERTAEMVLNIRRSYMQNVLTLPDITVSTEPACIAAMTNGWQDLEAHAASIIKSAGEREKVSE